MKKVIALILLAVMVQTAGFSQEVYSSSSGIKGYKKKPAQKGFDVSKLVLGSGFNFVLGGGFANFGISPRAGYKFNNYITAGVGLGYQYYKEPYGDGSLDCYNKFNIVYPSLWAKGMVWGPFYAAADLEQNIIFFNGYQDIGVIAGTNNPIHEKQTINGAALLVGAGYKYEMGGKFSSVAELMYDVFQNENLQQYYKQLVFRFGIYVGF